MSALESAVGRVLLARGALGDAARLLMQAAAHATSVQRRNEVADDLLALSRAWSRDEEVSDAQAHAEAALRRAADLAPLRGLGPLAQHLCRAGQFTAGINLWQQVIRAQPLEPSNYLSLAQVYERADNPQAALATYLALTEAVPSARNYLVAADRVPRLGSQLADGDAARPLRIAVIGNATLAHLVSYLTVECYRAGIRPEIYQGPFDQYVQDLLDPTSGLYTFEPDILICAIHPSRLFPELHGYPFDLSIEDRRAAMEGGLATVERLLDAFTQRSTALVLLHNMVLPQHPALGILDGRDELGQAAMFREINGRLAEMTRRNYKNVYIVDEDLVQSRVGKAHATDPRMWFSARLPWSDRVLPVLAREYLRYLRPHCGLQRKCVVVDLDNTLWGGVVGEDGLEGLQLGSDAPGNAFASFQRELQRLSRHGVLLAVCSKNNLDEARAVLESHPDMVLRWNDFAAHRINWAPKPENLRELAAELNLGLDSLVFLDDNPVERAQVRAALPEVLVPELPSDPAEYRRVLLELGVFESLALTDEDRIRSRLYAEQRSRREFEVTCTASGSLEEYLAQLEMVVEIEPLSTVSLPRIAQLTNRTNQFNLTTRRYSEADIEAMVAGGWQVYTARVIDRFGDNGLSGVILVAPGEASTWEIDSLLLSCRVMGRGIETALLEHVARQSRLRGGQWLRGWYLPTSKNASVSDCYAKHGFSLVDRSAEGGECWELDLTTLSIAVPPWLRVKDSELVA